MDAITLLKNDHKDVEKLFKRFENAGDQAYTEKREIVDRIIEALSKHAAIEEQLFYPVSRATVDDTEDVVLESMEEHHVVKWLLSELEAMDPRHERFDAKTTVLIENVRHHVEEEEDEFFPKVRDELGRNALNELGDAMQEARKIAPTHPHPRTPDTPPGNLVLGAAAGAVDRVTDTVSGVAQGSVGVLQDVIARVTGAKKRSPSPKGTPTARRAANRTRAQGDEATDRTVKAVQKARRTGEETVDDARRSVANTVRPPNKRTARKRPATARKTTRKATGATKRASSSTRSTANRTSRTAKKTTRKAATRTRSTAKKAAKRTQSTAKQAATRTRSTAKKAGTRTRTTAKKATKRAASATR
jgi:hemerythrin-like domain-containing protein